MTNKQQHLHDCEIRSVMKMSPDERRDYYIKVKKAKGETAARKMIDEVNLERKKLQKTA